MALRTILPASLILLLAAGGVQPVRAQMVTGRLMDGSLGQPIANAFVLLLDSAGTRRAATLTDSIGGFVLTAPAPGGYRLRAERLGYESVTSPMMRLGDTPVHYVFTLEPRALLLPPVDARSEDSRGCERRPDGRAVYALWDAVRQALTVAAWSAETRSLRFSMINHTRELDASLRTVKRETRTPSYAFATLPYGAVEPGHLAEHGYLVPDGEEYWLLGPDANVLLSESFLNSHCFRIVEARDRNLIGLGFTPLRQDERADISGVLWVDRRTSELRHLAYEYEQLPEHMRRFGAKGEIHFERLGNGIWIVKRWWIRSPLVGTRRGTRRAVLLGYHESGGTVTSADAVDTKLYGVHGAGVIEGMVLDSASRTPVPDALVFLSGKPFSARTDSSGRYRIGNVPEGSHAIGFTHPVLEELGVPLTLDTVRVTGRAPIERTFTAPSATDILRRLCPGEEEEATTGLVHGVVQDDVTGRPLPDVEVRASWEGPRPDGTGGNVDRWRTARTTADGRYFLCWMPRDRELELRVDARAVRSRHSTVHLSGAAVLRRDFQ